MIDDRKKIPILDSDFSYDGWGTGCTPGVLAWVSDLVNVCLTGRVTSGLT